MEMYVKEYFYYMIILVNVKLININREYDCMLR